MHVLQSQMRERRSTRTLPEYVRHDMVQSGRTCVQMTEHIMLLRDANTCRTWYTTTTNCRSSLCSKLVLKTGQQSFSSVEVQCCRSVGRPTTPQPRRGAKRLRLNIADLFLSNEVSGARAAALFEDAGAAGGAHVQDWRTLGHQKHRHRNLLTRLRMRSKWPKEYYAGIRVWMRSTQAVEVQHEPFLLIHQILDAIGQRSGDRLLDHGGLDGYVRSEFVSSCARLRLDGGDTVPLGLWCDGVATKWDRSESVEFVTLDFQGPKVVRAAHPHLRPRQVLRCFTAHA